MANIVYNDIEFPDINSVWTDKKTYPYAVCFEAEHDYYLFLLSEKSIIDSSTVYMSMRRIKYKYSDGVWIIHGNDDLTGTDGWSITEGNYTFFWSNHDIIDIDGFIYLAASDIYDPDSKPTIDIDFDSDFIRGYIAGQQLRHNLTFCNKVYSVGLVAVNTNAEAGVMYNITTQEQAINIFGTDGYMSNLASLVLLNGADTVVCVPIATNTQENYQSGFELLCQQKDIAILICDSTDLNVQKKMRDAIKSTLLIRHNRAGIVSNANEESIDDICARADGLFDIGIICLYSGKNTIVNNSDLSGCYLAACVSGVLAKNHLVKELVHDAKLNGVSITEHTPSSWDEVHQLLSHGVSCIILNGENINIAFLQSVNYKYGHNYCKPALHNSYFWYTLNTPKSSITDILLVSNYHFTGLETEYAIYKSDLHGLCIICVIGTRLIISSCGYGTFGIDANPLYDSSTKKYYYSSDMFSDFTNVRTIDIRLLEVDNGTIYNLSRMFYNCTALQAIYVSDKWNPSDSCKTTDMFKNCGVSEVTYVN